MSRLMAVQAFAPLPARGACASCRVALDGEWLQRREVLVMMVAMGVLAVGRCAHEPASSCGRRAPAAGYPAPSMAPGRTRRRQRPP